MVSGLLKDLCVTLCRIEAYADIGKSTVLVL